MVLCRACHILPPVWHHLDGDMAMRFVRIRFSRFRLAAHRPPDRGNKSLFNKLTSPANLPHLPGLVLDVRNDFQN